ncbi:DUF5329 family protein [Fluviispira vulneris]|uniref:DUF5329 family protein n=1 Tax=Fluviispira vulneris TaxID=2763012 RepID=UPI0016493FA1|nr:DUF5329 family protein [Fluviispira vulneris]
MIKKNLRRIIKIVVGSVFIVSCFLSFSEEKKLISQQDEEKIISKLIKTIAESNLKFIRNGSTYNAKEAAKHLQLKLNLASKNKFNGQITVCEFIKNVATKSSLSGLPYQIEVEAGKKILLQTWLIENLKKQDMALAERCTENSID